MSYLVLARKWRPRRFSELVGQEHVVKALSNALDSGRVHHAFLFTGTRGVGKTTIARIFAKSLNCEQGQSAEPCGTCNACADIDAGRFVDLLEIDAASNTGVDDVRDLIENAQYMPARGRVKVYLIDEVHMLSKNAFNALLKTLEEPPGHVKFLLATTDPQKLPVTVLSRCLQFNLRRLELDQIAAQMRKILDAENISCDDAAIALLARGADGSLRDGLSLLDQAIAYTAGKLSEDAVLSMLGSVDRTRINEILDGLSQGDGIAMLRTVEELSKFSPDYQQVLDDLALALHAIQVSQLVPDAAVPMERIDIASFAARVPAEVVQLWYQMAVQGRRDLELAPSQRVGFEMSLLRMLAFRPMSAGLASVGPVPTKSANPAQPTAAATVQPAPAAKPVLNSKPDAPATRELRSAGPGVGLSSNVQWLDTIAQLNLRGPVNELASNAVFSSFESGVLELHLSAGMGHLINESLQQQLLQAVMPVVSGLRQVRVTQSASVVAETLANRKEKVRNDQQMAAEDAFLSNPAVKKLLEQGGQTVPGSIKPQ